MKRHAQGIGVRYWSGQDFLDLQHETLRVFDGFFGQFPMHVVFGCEVTAAGANTYDLAPGAALLRGKDQDGNDTEMVVPFAGRENTALPVYLKLAYTVGERAYKSGGVKPIYYDFYAEAVTVQPDADTPCLAITKNGGTPFVDAVQDAKHRFVTDVEKQTWNGKISETAAAELLAAAFGEGEGAEPVHYPNLTAGNADKLGGKLPAEYVLQDEFAEEKTQRYEFRHFPALYQFDNPKYQECTGQLLDVPDYPGAPLPLDVAEVKTYSNSGNNLFRIAFGNGIYVRGGQYGIEYSYNKINWTTVDGTMDIYRGVRFVNGQFVVFGAKIRTSIDGRNWTNMVSIPNVSNILAGAGVYDIAYGNGIYVLAGYDYVYNSTDLTDIILRATYSSVLFGQVEFWNGCFVIGTNTQRFRRPLYSVDNGVTWNNMSVSGAQGTSFVVAGDVLIVADNNSTNYRTVLYFFATPALASSASKTLTIDTLYDVSKMGYIDGHVILPGMVRVNNVIKLNTGFLHLASANIHLVAGGVVMSNGLDFIAEDCEFISCGQSGYMAGAKYKLKVPDLGTEDTKTYIKLEE